MTRTFKILLGVAVVVFLTFLVVGSTRASTEPQVVHVTLTDSGIALSQRVVAQDRAVSFVVTNMGSLAHQFAVVSYEGTASMAAAAQAVIAPATTWTINRTFAAGVYRVECLNPDHVNRGLATPLAAQALPQAVFPVPMDSVIPILALALGAAYLVGDSLGVRLIRS